MATRTLTEFDIEDLVDRFKSVFVSKEDFTDYKSKLFNRLDKIVKNTSNTKQEIELIENRVTKSEELLDL